MQPRFDSSNSIVVDQDSFAGFSRRTIIRRVKRGTLEGVRSNSQCERPECKAALCVLLVTFGPKGFFSEFGCPSITLDVLASLALHLGAIPRTGRLRLRKKETSIKFSQLSSRMTIKLTNSSLCASDRFGRRCGRVFKRVDVFCSDVECNVSESVGFSYLYSDSGPGNLRLLRFGGPEYILRHHPCGFHSLQRVQGVKYSTMHIRVFQDLRDQRHVNRPTIPSLVPETMPLFCKSPT